MDARRVKTIRRALAGLVVLCAACTGTREAPPSTSKASETIDAAVASVDAAPSAERAAAESPAPPPEPPPACEPSPGIFFFTSPASPSAGRPLRVLAVTDRPIAGELRVSGGSGGEPVVTGTRRGGPPYFWVAEVASPAAGDYAASFTQGACAEGTGGAAKKVVVRKAPAAPRAPAADGIWRARAAWNRALENVYSAWIEALFDAPESEQPSWAALHEVLRDPKRNLLFDHLGAGEDSGKSAPVIRPDCADLPYFLRAYFAWKLELPFGLAECSRGGRGSPPSCRGLLTNEDFDERAEAKKKDGAVASFGMFLRGTLADRAHSGSARAPFEDENADYYPVRLSWESLRPGTIYADPYGHVLVVAKRVAQTREHGGVLYAVDGQPDGTVARKRFWRGNFLYARQRELGGPGFKRFRPVARRNGSLVRLDDDAIRRSPDYGDVSREPGQLDIEGFFDAMDDVLSPQPLDPERAMLETIDALDEQAATRVKSVDNGRRWLETARSPAPMPEGPEIFETNGPWEDFSTPSRDMRLLIAIDVVRGFPARVARRPERYAVPPGKSPAEVEAALSALLERELARRSITYARTDGSPQVLTLAEVLARSAAFEVAYNPNDCVELRWGAAPGSDEASTCRARAPAEQRARMEAYRAWFHDRRRPPRR